MFIRNAEINDLPYIVEIYNATIASRMVTADTVPVNTKDKEKWFWAHTGNRPIWIIEDDLQLSKIGWVSFSDFYGRPAYSGTAEISIFLDEKCRGKGYGKAILYECIKEAPSLQIKICWVLFLPIIMQAYLFLNLSALKHGVTYLMWLIWMIKNFL